MFNKLIFSLFLTVTLLLTGCGGSGGDEKPAPEPVPAPSITNFTSAKTSIMAGESIQLIAIFSNGDANIDNGVGPINSNAAKSITPETTSTYTLTVTNSEGISVTAQVTIEVIPPEIISFTASNTEVTAGEAVNLTAIFANGEGSIDVDGGSINSGGSKVVNPDTTTTYTLTVENAAGVKVKSTITIEIVRLRIVSIINPTDGKTVHDDTYIKVNVIANDNLNNVTAEVEGHSASFPSGSNNSNVYVSGYLPLSGLPDGDYILTITARDRLARTTSMQKEITVDNVPIIEVNSPEHNDITNPLLPLDVSCTEISGDCQITVKHQELVLATATNQLNETINLSDFIDEEVTLTIEGKNEIEQVATQNIIVYVVNSNIIHVKTFSDKIIDFDGQRALLYNDVPSEGKQLQIANISNYDVTLIEFNNAQKVDSSRSILTSKGTIFSVENGITYDWNNDELLSLGQTNIVKVAGDFAVYCDSNNLLLRSLSGQSNSILDTAYCSDINVSVNGTVVANKDGNVVRYKNQQETLLSPNVSMDRVAKSASISGSFISFYEVMSAFRSARNMLYSDNDNQVIFTGHSLYTGASGDYSGSALNNGWFVYGSGLQLLARDINGNTLQRTNFSTQSYIESIADNGELVFINEGKRYLSKPNGDLFLVGSSDFGRITYRNGTWYIIIEKSLYELTTP